MVRYLLYAISPCFLAFTRGDGVIQSMWDKTPIVVVMIALMAYRYTWALHMFIASFVDQDNEYKTKCK